MLPLPLPLITPLEAHLSANKPELIYQIDLQQPDHLYIQITAASRIRAELLEKDQKRPVMFGSMEVVAGNHRSANSLLLNTFTFGAVGDFFPEKRLQRGRYYLRVSLEQGEAPTNLTVLAQTKPPTAYNLGDQFQGGSYQLAIHPNSSETYQFEYPIPKPLRVQVLAKRQGCLNVGVLSDLQKYIQLAKETDPVSPQEFRPFRSQEAAKSYFIFVKNTCPRPVNYSLKVYYNDDIVTPW